MNHSIFRPIIFVACILSVASTVAQEQTPVISLTDWLTTNPGSEEEIQGAQVVSVESEEDPETTIVELKVPVGDPEPIENIVVIGRSTGRPIEQSKEAEWLTNYETGYYGIRIHLKQPAGFDFLIQFADRDVMESP